MFPGLFYRDAGPIFHCLAFHSFVYSLLLNKPLSITFPVIAYYLMDSTASIRMKEKYEDPVKISSSQFSTRLCSLQEHISSWNRDHVDIQTENRASHPPIFWGKYVLMNGNGTYPIQWRVRMSLQIEPSDFQIRPHHCSPVPTMDFWLRYETNEPRMGPAWQKASGPLGDHHAPGLWGSTRGGIIQSRGAPQMIRLQQRWRRCNGV